jgi:hypothetical protein
VTEDELREIEERAAKASPPPWTPNAEYAYPPGSQGDLDEQFTARAREDVPALVAEVRKLRAFARRQSVQSTHRGYFCIACHRGPSIVEAQAAGRVNIDHAPDCELVALLGSKP